MFNIMFIDLMKYLRYVLFMRFISLKQTCPPHKFPSAWKLVCIRSASGQPRPGMPSFSAPGDSTGGWVKLSAAGC